MNPQNSGLLQALGSEETSDTSAGQDFVPGSRSYMLEQAGKLGITGLKNAKKSEIASRLAQALTEHGARRTVGQRLGSGDPEEIQEPIDNASEESAEMPPAQSKLAQAMMGPQAQSLDGSAPPAALGMSPPASMPSAQPQAEPTASTGSGFDPNIEGRLQRMISLGANPDQIVAFLNGAVR